MIILSDILYCDNCKNPTKHIENQKDVVCTECASIAATDHGTTDMVRVERIVQDECGVEGYISTIRVPKEMIGQPVTVLVMKGDALEKTKPD